MSDIKKDIKFAEDLTNYTVTISFWIDRQQTYDVEVKAWFSEGMKLWHWNIYARIYENHPLFNKPEILKEEWPINCDISYSYLITTTPAFGIIYNRERIHNIYKLGCDYDSYAVSNNSISPFEKIPDYVKRDAVELSNWLKQYQYHKKV
jgi:hypothetical protein